MQLLHRWFRELSTMHNGKEAIMATVDLDCEPTKITIYTTETKETETEIYFPVYYEQHIDNGWDNGTTICGKLTENTASSITINGNENEITMENETISWKERNGYRCYLKAEYISEEERFMAALDKAEEMMRSMRTSETPKEGNITEELPGSDRLYLEIMECFEDCDSVGDGAEELEEWCQKAVKEGRFLG